MSVWAINRADGRRHLYRQLHEEGSGTTACNAGRALRVGWTVAASSTVNQTHGEGARNRGYRRVHCRAGHYQIAASWRAVSVRFSLSVSVHKQTLRVAPRSLRAVGIGAVIAPSYSRIFYRNALNLGLVIFELDLTDRLADGDQVRLDLDAPAIETESERIALPQPPAWLRDVWREGGIVAYYRRYGRLPLGES